MIQELKYLPDPGRWLKKENRQCYSRQTEGGITSSYWMLIIYLKNFSWHCFLRCAASFANLTVPAESLVTYGCWRKVHYYTPQWYKKLGKCLLILNTSSSYAKWQQFWGPWAYILYIILVVIHCIDVHTNIFGTFSSTFQFIASNWLWPRTLGFLEFCIKWV